MPGTDPDDDGERATVPVDIDPAFYQQWADARKALDEARAVFDDLDRRLRCTVALLSDECDARIVVDGQVLGRHVSYKASRFDARAFKRQFPDIHAQFSREAIHWRLTVSRSDR